MKIIDNFLTKTYHKNILEILAGDKFEWVYNDNITGPAWTAQMAHPEPPHFNEYGFTHTFWNEEKGATSPFAPFIQPLLYQILDITNCDLIWRARADMVTWSKEDFIYPAHIDYPFPNTATVFYVNETDGDTIFYNAKRTDVADYKDLKEYDRVSPKANRLVLFDGDFLHTGCSPTKHKQRILINSNYIKQHDKRQVLEEFS